MAEALGLASGVAGLVSLGLMVCQGLLKYYGSWKDSEAEVASMISSVNSLSETLTHLDRRITTASPSQDAAKQVQQSLDTCQAAFQKLDAKLKKINEKLPPGPHSKLERHIRKALYPFKASTLAKLQETIADARQNLHLALSVMHFETTSVAVQKLDDITAGIEQLHIAMALVKLNRDIRDWLNPPDPSSSYNSAASKRSLGTGNWFVDGLYNLWSTQPGSFYWLQGGPGCGKTVLSSTIVTATSLATEQEPSQPILYYYFDFQYLEKQVADNMTRSLIYQLANQNAETRSPLEQLFEDHGNGLRRPSSSNLLRCLKKMLETPSLGNIYVILDALDECKELPELLQILTIVRSWHETRLHLLVTSRPERVLKEKLSSLDPVTIVIQSDVVDSDIKTHVIGRLDKDSWWKQWSASIRHSVILTLTRRAKGMFRWVDCQLAELRKSLNAPMLKKCLETLPRDLDATYARILENIDEMYHDYARKILQWLCFANSPVTLDELNDVLATTLGENPSFDPDARFRDSRDVELVCSSLLSTSEEYIPDLNTIYHLQRRVSVIRFAHFSVKEYLMSDRVGRSVSRYKIHEAPGQRMMAETCLVYHLQSRHENQTYPLAGYALENWCKHWQSVSQIDEIAGVYHQAAKILGLVNTSLPDRMAEYEGFRCGDLKEEDAFFAIGTTYQDDVPIAGITYAERCQSLYVEEKRRAGLDVVASPLRLAIRDNSLDRLQLMLSHPIILRADRELFGDFALLPLELSIRCGIIAMAKVILEESGMDASDCTDMIHTHRFLDPSRPEEKAIAEEITLRLANINVEISQRSFLLPNPEHLRAAARRGDRCFIIEYELSYGKRFGSDRSKKDLLGFSAVDYAEKQGHNSILKLFNDSNLSPTSTSVGYSDHKALEQLEVQHQRSRKNGSKEKVFSSVIHQDLSLSRLEIAQLQSQPLLKPAPRMEKYPWHPSLKERSREPTRSSSRIRERVQSDSDEECFAPLPPSRIKTSEQFRERLRLNAICRMRFIATGYDLQHVAYLEAEYASLVKDDIGGVFGTETTYLQNCDLFTDFLAGLKKLYTSYSISRRQAEPSPRTKDELKPFWEHYLSQMQILRNIQHVRAQSPDEKMNAAVSRKERLRDLKELRRQDGARYREHIARSILNLDTSS